MNQSNHGLLDISMYLIYTECERRSRMLNLAMIGEKIAAMRKQKGMNQNDLADALFVTRQAVSKWEMGKSIPSLEVLLSITKLFHISIDYLLESSDIKESDFQSMFAIYSRPAVIYHFLNLEHPQKQIKNIFYLLTTEERRQIIYQVLHHQIDVHVNALWPYLCVSERMDLLGYLMMQKQEDDLSQIYPMLNTEERAMVNRDNDTYTVVYKKTKSKKKEE